jgi:hypothetical protein
LKATGKKDKNSAGCNVGDKLEYMPWYWRDFLLDDKVEVLLEDDRMKWWYLRLLAHQWDHGAIPLDGVACRAIVKPSFGTPPRAWDSFINVLGVFFPAADEHQGQNGRLEEIRGEVVDAADKRKQHAKVAASARWEKQRALVKQCRGNARAMPEQCPEMPTEGKEEVEVKQG